MKIAREGWPLVAIAAVPALALLAAPVPWIWLAVPAFGAVLFTLWFFRDPERRPPDDPTAFVAPADGRILSAGGRDVSIFMNVFNVHVCRTPGAGTVRSCRHHPGRFLAAWRDEAPEQNERAEIEVDHPAGRLRFKLVAGLVARRIVCRLQAGQELAAGERIGLIRFGSRVDVRLPDGAAIVVERGRHVRAGETVIARLSQTPVAPDGPGRR